MKRPLLSIFLIFLAAIGRAQHQTSLDPPLVGGTLPYSITLREISLAPAAMPTLHSVAAGKWDGQWILMAAGPPDCTVSPDKTPSIHSTRTVMSGSSIR